MEHQQQPHQQHHRSPYNELSTNQSLLHHFNTANKHQEHMDAQDFSNQQQQQQKYQQTMFVKNHYHSPKSRHMRRRARSECLSPSGSPQHYHNQNYQQHYERFNVKNHSHNVNVNGYTKDRPDMDQWRIHRHEEQVDKYHHEQNAEMYKHRFHNLQIDGKSLSGAQFDDLAASHDDMDHYNLWHQRRARASSESASHDYYYRDPYPDVDDFRVKRTREATISPTKERRPVASHHHVTNPKNNFSVLVNNTTHYRYSPKSKVRSHYVGHKVGLVRVSSPLHKARLQMWKSQSNSATSTSIPSTESHSTPETPQVDDYDDDDDDDLDTDDDEDPPGPSDQIPGKDELTDPEDNYESSLSISSSERSLVVPAPTINTESVQGGRVLSAPFAPSLFPFVPPYITFATFEEKGPEIPAIIHKQLKWKLTSITPLLVRKVLLNTGFRLMKSE